MSTDRTTAQAAREDATSTGAASRIDRVTWIVAAVLLSAAVVVRLGWLQWTEYSGDEQFFLVRAFEALHRGVEYGYPTSAGIRVAPFFVYLVALPEIFTRDPVLVAGFIAVLNLIGLVLLFFFVREWLGTRSAILVTLLMAAAPWSIMFSRKIWNLDAIFPLVVAMHLALYSNLREYRRWKVLTAFALFGAASQIHPSVALLLVPLVALYTIFRAPLRIADLALGVGIVALLYAPYIHYLLATQFDNFHYVASLRAKDSTGSPPFFGLLFVHTALPFENSSGANLPALLGMGALPRFFALSIAQVDDALARVLMLAMAIATAAAIAWSMRLVWRALRGARLAPSDQYFGVFAIALATPILFFADRGAPTNEHYYVFVYPIVIVYFVWALERVLRRLRAPSWSAFAIVAVISGVQLAFMASFFHFVASDPAIRAGKISIYYAPKRERCERELADAFDNVLHGDERRRAIDGEREKRFAASTTTLLRIDTRRNEPRAEPSGALDIEPTNDGLVVCGGTPVDMVALPEFPAPKSGRAILRMEFSSPDDGILLVFFQTLAQPQYSHKNVRDAVVRRGENTVYIELDEPELTHRLHVRLEVYRYVIHSLEIREVDR
jgi:hypothetical protein